VFRNDENRHCHHAECMIVSALQQVYFPKLRVILCLQIDKMNPVSGKLEIEYHWISNDNFKIVKLYFISEVCVQGK
jgi:hypothetical protein